MSSSLKRSLPPSSPAQPLPSSSPPLGIVEKQSVINLINVLGACVKCKGALKTAKTYDFAQAFSIIAVCHVCSLGYRFDSSSSVSINQKEVWDVPQRVIKTAILEGMTFEEKNHLNIRNQEGRIRRPRRREISLYLPKLSINIRKKVLITQKKIPQRKYQQVVAAAKVVKRNRPVSMLLVPV
jgi:hypothetical protein